MKNRTAAIRRNRAGFTLLELLIVLAIIVVIAAMVVPNLMGQQDIAKIQTTKGAIKNLESTAKMYRATHGDYPESLEMLMQPQNIDGKEIEAALENAPLDAWQNALHYEFPNQKADGVSKPAIWSNGPDQKDDSGSGDDINNWTVQKAKGS